MKSITTPWLRLLLVMLVIVVLFIVALYRLDIDTDILSVMPTDDPVIVDSAAVFKRHPMRNRIMIDIFAQTDDPDLLVTVAQQLTVHLKTSGLFKAVGNEEFQRLMPKVVNDIPARLPYLFTAADLTTQIQPLLSEKQIYQRTQKNRWLLTGLDGIGQAKLIAKDPLNLREVVLSRLTPLMPAEGVRLHRGQILSADGHHLLLIAQPFSSGTDTTFARRMTALMQQFERELKAAESFKKHDLTLTPLGAYRAALDNEELIRKDVSLALLLATVGIAVLLILAFPRPWIGLLSLLPALAGTMLAFFVYSLFNDAISIMVLGFGGAIISITVDHGIAYFLFLDRPETTDGKEVSEEIRSLGLLTVLTTIGAFAILCFSGFPVFVQLGQFAALGIGFSFLFVHTIFPKVFPRLAPGRRRLFRFRHWVDRLAGIGSKGAWAALIIAMVMLFLATPRFETGMATMNSVSNSTQAAEKVIHTVWGDLSKQIYMMIAGGDLKTLQARSDTLSKKLSEDFTAGVLSSGFVPSHLFPGDKQQKENWAAWQAFWSPARVDAVKMALNKAASDLGFTEEAFAPFIGQISQHDTLPPNRPIPSAWYDLLGISRDPNGSQWFQVLTLKSGPHYDPASFRQGYSALAKIFDPNDFSEKLGSLLFYTFTKLLIMVAAGVILLLLFFFLDLTLTLIALLPVGFALIATLGTLNLMGRPIDIPGLMLAVVVLGMGIDYSLFFVRSHQRYDAVAHPRFSLIRMAVFMAAVSTLIGFGVLVIARHSLLQSAGITSFFGIAYSLLGTFLILPPLLTFLRRRRSEREFEATDINSRVRHRYRHMETYPRLFARFKLKLDPLFAEIETIMTPKNEIQTILDIGSGYGVPGSWLLERFPDACLYGIEPLSSRVHVASRAMDPCGTVTVGSAPTLPELPGPADLAVMLDMAHFLDDAALRHLLIKLHERIRPKGQLLIRVSIEPSRKRPWYWWVEKMKHRLQGLPAYYRSREQWETMLATAQFQIETICFSGPHQEQLWVVATTN